ncbi:unnamed protein product [Arabis nemorensis]|uniref:Uncharacterized protein n=1 Tax=Arabis nemorensis TaxID=586526 RepID=A0A565AZP9_9BRAS|nr:unnamed protein product [Arabis nemorensis]
MVSSISSASTGVKFVPEDTFLQRHAAFFDRNKDGLRAIGCGYVFSAFAAVIINIGLSSKTRPGKGFSWSFPIEIKNIHLAKHGSDTDAYDENGRFVASKFEEIFAKHAKTHPDALTNEELKQLLNANKEPNDRRGAFAEWKLLHHLCKDKNGLLHKDSVRAVYDGSIFEKLEKQRVSKKYP